MNQSDTPRTNAAINASEGQWSFVLIDCSSELERELTAVTEQRDALAAALRKLRDCDFVITPHDRMDAVRDIARSALTEANL